MKILSKSIVALGFLVFVVWAIRTDAERPAGSAHAAALGAGDAAWRRSPLWDDGNAEYCAYEVDWPRYGHRFPGRALLILVKEPWAPDLEVKADEPRRDGFDVLKLNHVRDVPTGVYTYHQMASVYLRRDSAAVQKIAATSSEACGVTTAQLVGGRLSTRSYFDGEGERTLGWPRNAVPEDGLPALLRDYVAGEAPETLAVFPTLLATRFEKLAPETFRVTKRDAGAVTVPAGSFPAVEVRLERDGGFLAYAFEREAPHRLLRFEDGKGTGYRLAKCERIPYWQMHDPGDEAWLPASVRSK